MYSASFPFGMSSMVSSRGFSPSTFTVINPSFILLLRILSSLIDDFNRLRNFDTSMPLFFKIFFILLIPNSISVIFKFLLLIFSASSLFIPKISVVAVSQRLTNFLMSPWTIKAALTEPMLVPAIIDGFICFFFKAI